MDVSSRADGPTSNNNIPKEDELPAGFHSISTDEARCVGSSHGWLAWMNLNDSSLSIRNPHMDTSITPLPSSIPLPPLPIGSSSDDVRKLILSADPYDDDYLDKYPPLPEEETCSNGSSSTSLDYKDVIHFCMAIAIIGPSRDLAFCHSGDTEWTILAKGTPKKKYGEIMFSSSHGCLYAMHGGHRRHYLSSHDYSIESWDILGSHRKEVHKLPFPKKIDYQCHNQSFICEPCYEKNYLVEFSGDIFLVNRRIGHVPPYRSADRSRWSYGTKQCNVYKLDDDCCLRWKLVTKPIAASFFVGLNHSFSSVAFADCMRNNHVYYTDDYFDMIMRKGGRLGWLVDHDSAARKIGRLDREYISFFQYIKSDLTPSVWIQTPDYVKSDFYDSS